MAKPKPPTSRNRVQKQTGTRSSSRRTASRAARPGRRKRKTIRGRKR